MLAVHLAGPPGRAAEPEEPDFQGLTVMTASRLGATGGVFAGNFAKFVAEEQKSEAFTLKQQRLYAEEEGKRKEKHKNHPDKKP